MDHFSPANAIHKLARVVENTSIARDTYRLRIADPAIAGAIKPGQFVMIRPGAEGASDPLLGRPLALYEVIRDTAGNPTAFDVVYLVVGRGTAALSERRPGDRVAVWGPLGNGFGPAAAGSIVMVAGGIGQTPFLALARWWLGQAAYGADVLSPETDARTAIATTPPSPSESLCTGITVLYGVRTAALFAGVDDFKRAGIDVELATDDGTAGYRGYVTDLLARRLERGDRPAKIVGCGPPAMLATVARIAHQHRVQCDVSLENQMACGFGACFSCVAPIRQTDGSTDLRRVCVEGPVVAADLVDWTRLGHGPT